jgi:hypothetical protein
MGFRFRKSINIGSLRINFSKSGIGYSIGNSFFRRTKTAKGTTRKNDYDSGYENILCR